MLIKKGLWWHKAGRYPFVQQQTRFIIKIHKDDIQMSVSFNEFVSQFYKINK